MKFYYIEGISKTDTPLFSSLGEQDDYFSERIVADLDVYYPPYFENKIAIPSSGLQYNQLLDLKVNYLSIDFKQKTYYYFIKNIEYITEDEYAIEIEMDTIQTFMFNVDYQHARIRRMTIPRWKSSSGLINRDYIRENYGNDNFKNYSYQDITNPDYSEGFIVAKFPSGSNYSYQDRLSRINYTGNFKGQSIQEGAIYVLIPSGIISTDILRNYTREGALLPDIRIDMISGISGSVTGSLPLYELYLRIREYSEKPDLIDMYYIPYNPFKDITISSKVETVTKPDLSGEDIEVQEYVLTYTYNSVTRLTSLFLQDDVCLRIDKSEIELKSLTIDTEVQINKNKLQLFNYKFIPQLIDENYMSIQFGEKINRTTYPLSLSRFSKLKGVYTIDIPSGFRTYRLLDTLAYFTDTYDTTLVVNTKEQATIYNDAWKTFASQHQSSLSLGRILSGLSVATNAFTSKRPLTGLLKGSIDMAQTEIGYANYKHIPDTLSQGNNYSSDVLNESLSIVSIIKQVTNIEDVATIYESIGYRVDKFVKGTPLALNNRYYYNYYECSEIDIVPYAFITTEIEDDIKERWNNGLRFWTWHPEIQQFMGDTGIGNICEYDNVEIDLIEE